MREEWDKKNEFMEALKVVAPGTPLREGLNCILRANTGALIVIGDHPDLLALADGGFMINKEYCPSQLYELAKMDGAIILSKDAKTILFANTQLIPNPTIPTTETGIRHRTAERMARHTGELVISISKRRNVITLYKGDNRYLLEDTGRVLTRANQALQTLEKYRAVLDNAMINLGVLEYENEVSVYDVVITIQRTEMVMRIVDEIHKYVCELGIEGRLVSMQLEELVNHTEENGKLILQDYYISAEGRTVDSIQSQIRLLTQEELLDQHLVAKIIGFSGGIGLLENSVTPRGYRILNKVPKIPPSVVNNLVSRFLSFQGILNAGMEELDDVDGIGEIRARTIIDSLKRMQEQLILDNRNL